MNPLTSQMPDPTGLSPDVGAMPDGLHDGVLKEHDQNRSQLKKLDEAASMIGKVKGTLGGLSKMGDTVTVDDVIQGASELVRHGLSATAVAGLLAGGKDSPPMPQNGGSMLASWISTHVQGLEAREAQLAQAQQMARHALGVSGVHALMSHDMSQMLSKRAAPMAQPSLNPLAPEPGGPDQAPGPLSPRQ